MPPPDPTVFGHRSARRKVVPRSLVGVSAWTRTAVRRRVVVNLKSGKAFRGVLLARRGPLLVLVNAELIEQRQQPIPVDGQVVVERAAVEFMQVLAGEE